MTFTDFTKNVLRQRRWERKMLALGYEEIGENGGKLWEIHRGYRHGQKIVAAAVPPNGLSVWVKIEGRNVLPFWARFKGHDEYGDKIEK